MKKFIIFLTIALCFSASAITIKAVSPTPEATDSAVQEIRDKVKEIVREKLDETQKGQRRAFVGEITNISDLQLTLQTNQGDKQLNIATDAALIGKGSKKITMKDLKTGLFAITMGFMEENDVLGVRRLVVSEKPKTASKEIAFGKVTDISTEEKILTVKNEKKGIIYTVEINDKTTITKKVDDKIQKIKFAVIENSDWVVAIGTTTENEHKLITAKIVHVIPGLSTVTPSPEITPKSTAAPTP